jgi:hypothetical protein
MTTRACLDTLNHLTFSARCLQDDFLYPVPRKDPSRIPRKNLLKDIGHWKNWRLPPALLLHIDLHTAGA